MLLFTSLPSIMLSGFDQLRYDNTPADWVLHFYEQFWGVPLPQEHISLKGSVHDPNDGQNDKEKKGENDKENGGENDEENGEENDEENGGGDLLPPKPPPIIETEWIRLYIRAEYLRIYDWVEKMYEVGSLHHPSAIVVTGQTGIG